MDEADQNSVPAYLEAFDGYVPWLVGLIAAIVYRDQISALMSFVTVGVREQGRSAKLGPLELGQAQRIIVQTEDLQPEIATGEVQIEGNPDQLILLTKAVGSVNDRFFTKSTKALEVDGGCLVQVSTELRSGNGSLSAAEALSFIPGVRVRLDADGTGGTLVSSRDE